MTLLLEPLGDLTVLWPRMLWLLVFVPVLVIAYLRFGARRRRSLSKLDWSNSPSATGTVRSALRRHIPPALFVIGLTALIGAVARPQAYLTLPSIHKNVVLAIDSSGSMRATDVKPNRLAAAQNAAKTFIENQQRHTRIGIVTFAATASVVQSPTDNRDDLILALDRLQLQPGTAMGSAIYIALATLLPDAGINMDEVAYGWTPGFRRHWSSDGQLVEERKPVAPGSNRSVAVVLLSDGQGNHGPDALDAAKFAAGLGVRVYTVGIGSPEGITLGFSGWSMRVRLDEAPLKKIAEITRGEYFAARTAPELKRIYEQLSARMVIESRRATEVTALFVAFGALLLVISALCSVLWFNRVL